MVTLYDTSAYGNYLIERYIEESIHGKPGLFRVSCLAPCPTNQGDGLKLTSAAAAARPASSRRHAPASAPLTALLHLRRTTFTTK